MSRWMMVRLAKAMARRISKIVAVTHVYLVRGVPVPVSIVMPAMMWWTTGQGAFRAALRGSITMVILAVRLAYLLEIVSRSRCRTLRLRARYRDD